MCTTGRLTRAMGSHSSSMYMHPSASNPRTCKSIEYVDYTKNLLSPAEDSVPYSKTLTCVPSSI